jgi:hypothetical protein
MSADRAFQRRQSAGFHVEPRANAVGQGEITLAVADAGAQGDGDAQAAEPLAHDLEGGRRCHARIGGLLAGHEIADDDRGDALEDAGQLQVAQQTIDTIGPLAHLFEEQNRAIEVGQKLRAEEARKIEAGGAELHAFVRRPDAQPGQGGADGGVGGRAHLRFTAAHDPLIQGNFDGVARVRDRLVRRCGRRIADGLSRRDAHDLEGA